MATRNINLTESLDQFVGQMIAAGAFQNASEVVRAGLRLLRAQEEERTARLEAIKSSYDFTADNTLSLLAREQLRR